jgi:PKD repeat protein
MAPTLLTWQSSDSYLTLGVKSTTTLSVNAMDPELDTLTYQWSVVEAPAGASVVLAAPTAASCGASGLTAEGLYVFSVEVGDGQHSATREVLLRVFNGNQPPVFNNVGIRTPIRPILPIDYTTLDSGASDIEGSTVSYLWSVVSQPAGAAAVLANPTNQRCGVSGLSVAGDYVFRIEASDGSATSASNLTVTVYPEDVHAPAISNLAAALLGDGTGGALSADTSDADGDWISHWWEVTSKPVGSKVLFSNQGGPSTEVHADTSGSYSFKLTVVGPNQYTVSAVKTLSLPAADLPVTQFFASLTEGTLPLTVSFYNGSIGNITNCLWDFGDGATTNSTAEYVLHTYTEAGIKSVTMIAQGPAGSSTNTQPDLITVRLPGVPLADFTASPSSGWIPLAVTFTDTSGGTVTNRFWDFGDGSTTNTTEAIITHTYTAAGTNTVTLIAAGPAGTDTNIQPACVVATIPVAPTANFTATPHSGLTPLEVSFANISTGDITNSVWDFGDGTTLTSTSTGVNHTYTNAGSFTITLTVSGPAGSSTNTQAGLIDVELSTSTTVDITANTADRYITESTPLAYRPTGDTGCRVGDNSSGQRLTYVIPFQLPEIATGETITDVTLHLYAGAKTSFSSATDVYIDILGGRVDASATVTDADVTGTTAVLAANAQIINKNVTTPFTADHVLDAAFFQNIYNSDPSVAGKFVFITLRANKIDPISSNSYITYNAADASANKPVLSITSSAGSSGGGDTDGDGIPDEWETTWFGGATNANPNALASNGVNTLLEAYIAGLDPTDPLSRFTISNTWNVLGWNAISGRIYSVWGTTNLLESFQCLESNLLWPRNSWTDPVERSGAFYKIDVQLQN